MKTKFNLKTLLVLAILLIIMCVFNTNLVQATDVKANETKTTTDTTETKTPTTDVTKATTEKVETKTTTKATPNKDTLQLIPDTMNVNIKEIEFQKSEDELEKSISKILADNNIDMTNYTLNVWQEGYYEDDDFDIHKFEVSIIKQNQDNTEIIAEKKVTVKYSNTDKYNANDEKAIQKIMSNTGYVWHYETVEARKNMGSIDNIYQKEIDKIISPFGNDVKCIAVINGRSGYDLSSVIGLKWFYFKNDVCYGTKNGAYYFSYEIVVPEDVRDTEKAYTDYAKEYLKNNLEYDASNFTIKYNKNIDQYEIFNEGEYVDWIHIGKKDVIKVHDDITVSSNENVTLSAETIKNDNSTYKEMQKLLKDKGYTNIFNAYELKLADGKIGKDGLTIRFDLGTENNGKQAIVLHKKHDGTYEEFVKTVENGRISITVSELSPFIIAVKGERTLDGEPKTGVADYTIFASAIALISLGGLAITKLKK